MITQDNLRPMLESIGFIHEGDEIWRKRFRDVGCEVSVDFGSKTIGYPKDLKTYGTQTCNFSQNENFVVLECVCRLLQKGYRPESIELEHAWHLGHGSKGGRADICVRDTSGENMLLIIECKTAGVEFRNAWRDTLADGAQLFSYRQQDSSTQWLMLYSADWTDGEIRHEVRTIPCRDDSNVVAQAQHDDTVLLYSNASTVEELYRVWNETYSLRCYGDIVFTGRSVAYSPQVSPLLKKDLKDFNAQDRIVNRFEEILRHNNISDKENAFNRLVALFIAKLQDELYKGPDDEVEFQYKLGTDTYESLQDRLQRLHHDGMSNLMNEDVLYVPDDYAENVLRQYTGTKRDGLIQELKDTFRKLKFYTNNDFAFKDVYNEELFLQNGKVLIEIVQLFQPYRLVDSGDLQFLGDLFEQLLNQGFKQNEGQFFTPVPITRFIWRSLPLDEIMSRQDGSVHYPRTIDYAAGAGHFITEGAEQVASMEDEPDRERIASGFYGVEKDYRLSRVSRIALFMHGFGNGNIVFGDGLDNHPAKGIENGGFDILVANPPYSVSSFKPYLNLRNNKLRMLDSISDSGNEIETCFVERAGQLVRPGGVAALILPATILSKATGGYVPAREELLRNFMIRAIVRLGSGTFGATSTNTVVLFLSKYDEPPKRMDMVRDSVEAIFSIRDLSDWEDNDIRDSYLADVHVDRETMVEFVTHSRFWRDWLDVAHFEAYARDFEKSPELRSVRGKRKYVQSDEDARRSTENAAFYAKYDPVERAKVYYYGLTYNHLTLVVNSPESKEDFQAFVGYAWSNGKGREGIQIISDGGLLYPTRDNQGVRTISELVRDSYDENLPEGTIDGRHAVYRTSSLLDLNGAKFNQSLYAPRSAFRQRPWNGAWPVMPLSRIVDLRAVRTGVDDVPSYVTTDNMLPDRRGIRPYTADEAPATGYLYEKDDVLVSNIRPYLKKIWIADGSGAASPDILILRVKDGSVLLPQFLYTMLSQDEFFEYGMSVSKGIKMPRGDKNRLMEYAIPVPDMETQGRVAERHETLRANISDLTARIDAIENERMGRFRRMFTDNPDARSWKSRPLGELGGFRNGVNYDRNAKGHPYRIVTVSDFANRRVLTDIDGLAVRNIGFEPEGGQLLENGDFLFVRSNGNMNLAGRCMRVDVPGGVRERVTYSGFCIKFTLETDLDPDYLLTFLKTSRVRERLVGEGSNIKNISQGMLGLVPVPIPPVEMQERYAEFERRLTERQTRLETELSGAERELSSLVDDEFRR